jgi:predicted amidophosphoribosyltransferase
MPRWADAMPVVRALERFLLPGECLLCRSAMPAREWDGLVCPLCRARWRPVPPPWCGRCGQPGLVDVACRFCIGWPGALGRVRSAVWLEGSAREAVHHLKYNGWPGVAVAMAMSMRGLEPLTRGAVLVPVPLSRRRLRKRGYNQAAVLAGSLAMATGLTVGHDVLQRARETPTQTALTPEARAANVAGAFMAPALAEGTFVLVDDVCTTGATLAAAAEALMGAGAGRVDAVTFARAPLPVEFSA